MFIKCSRWFLSQGWWEWQQSILKHLQFRCVVNHLGSCWCADSVWVDGGGDGESLAIQQSPRCCWFCQSVRHTSEAMAAVEITQGASQTTDVRVSRDADFNWPGYSLGSRSLKNSAGESSVKAVCCQVCEPVLNRFISELTFNADLDPSAFLSSLNHILPFLSSSAQKMPSFSKMLSFLN